MVVRCINPKTYALTKNSSYIVIDETSNRYQIKNDKNLIRNYAKDLFTIVDESVSAQPEEVNEVQQNDNYEVVLESGTVKLLNNGNLVSTYTLNPNISDFNTLQVCDTMASDCENALNILDGTNIQDEELLDNLLDSITNLVIDYYFEEEFNGYVNIISIPSNSIESELTSKLLSFTNGSYNMIEKNNIKVFTLSL